MLQPLSNLYLCDSAKSCPSTFIYFGILQKIFAIFSASVKRWQILKFCKSVVKYPSSTRRESKISNVKTVRFEYFEYLKTVRFEYFGL